MNYVPCPQCHRHLREGTTTCVFCGSLATSGPAAALLALSLLACDANGTKPGPVTPPEAPHTSSTVTAEVPQIPSAVTPPSAPPPSSVSQPAPTAVDMPSATALALATDTKSRDAGGVAEAGGQRHPPQPTLKGSRRSFPDQNMYGVD